VFGAFLCLVGAMVPVVRAVLTTPYRRSVQWDVKSVRRQSGRVGREFRQVLIWTGRSEARDVNEHMQTTKLERISVKGDRRKAETVKVCRRERQVVKLCVVSSAGLLVGDDAWGSPRARHEITVRLG
jgi:hypothetical protein